MTEKFMWIYADAKPSPKYILDENFNIKCVSIQKTLHTKALICILELYKYP